MMAHKHLHELLNEDQEPFLLKNYIADRQSQLKRLAPKTSQAKKRKPLIDNSTSKRSLFKQACFISFQDSPDVRKSPFLDFPSPATAKAKSPCKSPNAVLLHIPSRTAALLLDAAMRIQKQSSSLKHKTQVKNVGFGLFGSILKKLSSKNRTRKWEIGGDGARDLARKSAGKSEKVQENVVAVDDKSAVEMGFTCSCNNSRRCSTVWSESNEEKSLDLEISSSSRSEESEEIEFTAEERENGGFDFCEKHFCSSPLSPFRFALQNNHSPGGQTPVFSSPATSPSRHKKQEEENCEVESIQNTQLEEEEEEKEQCSPVSVLDPPFEDDDGGNEDRDEEEDGYDLECSYAIVQRAKQQLLHKLCRFERLAELDPIELERRMLEEDDNEDENEDLEEEEEEEEEEEDESLSSCREKMVDGFVREVLSKSGLHYSKVSADMKRLVSDLIAEEKGEDDGTDDSQVMKRVCKRLDSWKEVQSNTIDMMVDLDFRRELKGWKRNDNKEQVGEAAVEIELAIFGLLMEELSEELVCSHGL